MPKNWSFAKILHISNVIAGQSPAGENLNKAGIEFHQGKSFFGDKYLTSSHVFTNNPTKIIDKNSIVLCVRAPVGNVNITTTKICIGRGLAAIIPIKYFNVEFLYYALKNNKSYFDLNGTGTTFKSISVDCVKNLIINVAPHKQQVKIVKYIENIYDKLEVIKAAL